MTLTTKPLHPLFAAEVADFDLHRPLSATDVAEINDAMLRHAVLVFRNETPLTDEEHIAFSSRFGPLQQMKMLNMLGDSKIRMRYPELIDVGNLDENGNILGIDDRRRKYGDGNRLWHSDVTFDPVRATFSFLNAHIVPPDGADTEFADMRAAYDELPESRKAEIEGLVAEHSVWYSRALGGLTEVSEEEKATRPPSRHKLVHVRPGSDRKSLYLASHASHIVGMPVEEGRALLRELTEFATQPQFVYRHKWRPGDLLIWDNLATMHRGTEFDDARYVRDMRRTTALEAA